MAKKDDTVTYRELIPELRRIESNLLFEIKDLRSCLDLKVDYDEEYKARIKKIDEIWDWKNKIAGYSSIIGAIAGIIASFVFSLIQSILNRAF